MSTYMSPQYLRTLAENKAIKTAMNERHKKVAALLTEEGIRKWLAADIQHILKTMRDVNDIETYVGMRWKKNEHNFPQAEIYDSRLGLNAPTILTVDIQNWAKSATFQRKEALHVFKDWLRGIREKVSKF